MKKRVILFSILGSIFLLVEYVFRCISYDMNFFHPALLLMFFIGGICALLIGEMNEVVWINNNFNIFWQSIMGMFIILIIEFISGLIVNVLLGLRVWDYSQIPLNLYGQVCIPFAALWFAMCPLGFWIDDMLRYYIYGGRIAPYTLFEIYKEFLNPFNKPFVM